jgi:hypothetical protein
MLARRSESVSSSSPVSVPLALAPEWKALLLRSSGADEVAPFLVPFHATVDELAGLPPHLISVNQLDPVRDEGVASPTTTSSSALSHSQPADRSGRLPRRRHDVAGAHARRIPGDRHQPPRLRGKPLSQETPPKHCFRCRSAQNSAGDLRNDRCRSPRSPYMRGDYAGGADRTWITASSGSGDVAVSPMYGWASSKTRNRSVASSTPTVATNA